MVEITNEDDWYTTKDRILDRLGLNFDKTEITDFKMDEGFKWVNSELSAVGIDANNELVKEDLKESPDIEFAQSYYVCFLISTTKQVNNPTQIVNDGQVSSVSMGQGDLSVSYNNSEVSKNYREDSTPNFYLLAQRHIRKFNRDIINSFKQVPTKIVGVSNAFDRERGSNEGTENRLYKRRYYGGRDYAFRDWR